MQTSTLRVKSNDICSFFIFVASGAGCSPFPPQLLLFFFSGLRLLDISVTVEAEELGRKDRVVTNTSFFKFVKLDEKFKTAPVRPLLLETKEDVKNFLEGQRRYEESRKERAKRM